MLSQCTRICVIALCWQKPFKHLLAAHCNISGQHIFDLQISARLAHALGAQDKCSVLLSLTRPTIYGVCSGVSHSISYLIVSRGPA